jgi:sulfatase modifying factor 1
MQEEEVMSYWFRNVVVVGLIVLVASGCAASDTDGSATTPSTEATPASDGSPTQSPAPAVAMIPIVGPGENGVFMMGSSDDELEEQSSLRRDRDYYTDDEQPLHQVTLTVPYSIGEFEITNQQFCAVINWAIDQGYAKVSADQLTDGTGQYVLLGLEENAAALRSQRGIVLDGAQIKPAEGKEDHPVHAVTWYGAILFCNCLSELSGLEPVYTLATWTWDSNKNGYRLPTEAEWEYAARGTTRHVYAWGDEMSELYLRYADTRPVGYFDGTEKDGKPTESNASPFGVYDMTGSVWEWVWDWYGRGYYAESPATDPLGPDKGDDRPPYNVDEPTRVWRGGGYQAWIEFGYLRIAKRWSCDPGDFYNEVGFRIAQTLR